MYKYALFRLNSQVMFYILAANSKAQRRLGGRGLCLGARFFRVVKNACKSCENIFNNLIILKILPIKNPPNFCYILSFILETPKTLLYTMHNMYNT